MTTGTFLRGRIYLGQESFPAGRRTRDDGVEPPSNGLATLLEDRLQLPLGRLKTGTPPRLDGTTIDWDQCEPQESERPPFAFSFLNDAATPRGYIDCYRTNTNLETHKIVMDEAHTLAPPSTTGTGPRYCPSIYKKVERFGDRSSHGVWLEPEGLKTDLVYPNGLSGAYPLEVQERIINSIVGLENAKIVQPGYDVEYDFVDPKSLHHDLQVQVAPGLFLAGQICGTTGYEEAAALGIVAGANAGLFATTDDSKKFILSRRDGYIGVLVDDLVTRGTQEPYRMFTSRAEYRLHLRADNADLRLTPLGHKIGLVDDLRYDRYRHRQDAVSSALKYLDTVRLPVDEWYTALPDLCTPDQRRRPGMIKSAADILKMPRAHLADVEAVGNVTPVPREARDTVAAECKYGAYVDRQDRELENFKRNDQLFIPPDIDYSPSALPALSSEEREKLYHHRPKTFADASSISGITPASLVYLYNHVVSRRQSRRPTAASTTS